MSERVITIIETPRPVDWLPVLESFALPLVLFLAVTVLVVVIFESNKPTTD